MSALHLTTRPSEACPQPIKTHRGLGRSLGVARHRLMSGMPAITATPESPMRSDRGSSGSVSAVRLRHLRPSRPCAGCSRPNLTVSNSISCGFPSFPPRGTFDAHGDVAFMGHAHSAAPSFTVWRRPPADRGPSSRAVRGRSFARSRLLSPASPRPHRASASVGSRAAHGASMTSIGSEKSLFVAGNAGSDRCRSPSSRWRG